jgi:putative sugar O-methyltransferase
MGSKYISNTSDVSSDAFHATMDEMMVELEKDSRYLPSKFWRDINAKNLNMIVTQGLENFKRTVSQNYYNWLITRVRDLQFRSAIIFWFLHPSLKPLTARIESDINLRFTTSDENVHLTAFQRFKYKIFACLVWLQMLKHDKHGLAEMLSEPTLGNPIRIVQDGKLITQDLANSIVECNVVIDNIKGIENPKIAEIGAGSGRLAHAYASSRSGRYMIFDIPPALMVSQWYLSNIFPNKRIFKFRSFENFETIRNELESSDIAFFSANQIEKIPSNYFDLILSISTLPEMHPDQASMYLDVFARVSSKFIYLKQWRNWKNPLDGTNMKIDDYKFNDSWSIVMDRVDPLNPKFFNRVWEKIELSA